MNNKIYIRVLSVVNKIEWDSRLKTSPQGNFYQSSTNADFFERFYCYKPIYALAEDMHGNIKGSLLFFKAPESTKTIALLPFKKAFAAVLDRADKMMLTWKCGPVVYDYKEYQHIFTEFLKFAENFSMENKIKSICMASPPFHNKYNLKFSCNGWAVSERATVIVDLSLPVTELWEKLKKSSRYDIRKARKDGIRILISDKIKDLDKFYMKYFESCLRNKIIPYPKEMFSFLIKNGGKLFIALYRNMPIAGILSMEYNKIADQRYLWNSKFAIKNKLFAMHLITWEMIEYYKNNGCLFFDFVGINIKSSRPFKDEGIYKFKTRWGGEKVCFPEFNKKLNKT